MAGLSVADSSSDAAPLYLQAGIGYVLIPEEDVTLKGAPKTYHDTKTLSKRTVIRQFCGDCGRYSNGPFRGQQPKA
ncbi:hypothetical protein Unana1_05442 [Umbelopsis nana]